MYGFLLDDKGKKFLEEIRQFVKSVPSDLLRAMDRDEIRYPREFGSLLKNLTKRGFSG